MSLNDKAAAALKRELAKCFPERAANDPGHARLAAALSDTAHTPGPWIVCEGDSESQSVFIEQDRECLIDEEPSTIGEIDLSGEGIDKIVGLANARLIAAAPELLEACKAILRVMETDPQPVTLFKDGHRGFTPDAICATESLRLAIARAEGGAK